MRASPCTGPCRGPRLSDLNESLGLSADTSGRYLLIYQWNDHLQLVDLATWRVRSLPENMAHVIDVAW
jgi:hypothetical protein